MILSIVGPDRVGKTTLFEGLRSHVQGAVFVPSVPWSIKLTPVVDAIADRTEALWEALYRPELVYVCDRGPFVDNCAYSRMRSPCIHRQLFMTDRLRVLLLDAESHVLTSRGASSQEVQARIAYWDILKHFEHCYKLDASKKPETVLADACQLVRRLCESYPAVRVKP